jgi:maltooligosyltrehalose trehalohydrolase
MRACNFGAHLISPNQVRFRLWAPDCQDVSLVIAGQRPEAMTRNMDGIFEIVAKCSAGSPYKYKVLADLLVPDPASFAQAGDVHDESIVVDHRFDWQHRDWRGRPWHETIIYELHVGTFGGFDGVKAQLPRLAALGVTAIQLMPIADFPGRYNWGYDGVLPYAPDAAYGSPDQLKSLIDAAHGCQLQVFLDVVYNHFGPDGNYLNAYASSFFDKDVHTPWGGAVNVKLPQVKRYFIENALFWLNTYKFDGLRFDAVHAIKDNDFLLEMASDIRLNTKDRHVHLILENENNDASLLSRCEGSDKFDAQWTDDWHHCLHVLLTGESEGYYQDFYAPANQLARCLAEGFAYQGESSKHADGVPRGTPSAHLPSTAFVICLQNHDQIGNRALGERLTTLAQPDALRAAILLLLMTPQIPMIFMGEEWGETNPFLFFTDHHGELADAVRDGRRKEFSHFEAFTDPLKRERIPDPNIRETFESSVPNFESNKTSFQTEILHLYQKCIEVRSTSLTPYLPKTRSLAAIPIGQTGVRAQWRLGNGDVLTIAANFGPECLQCEPGGGKVLISSASNSFSASILPAYSAYAWLEAS